MVAAFWATATSASSLIVWVALLASLIVAIGAALRRSRRGKQILLGIVVLWVVLAVVLIPVSTLHGVHVGR